MEPTTTPPPPADPPLQGYTWDIRDGGWHLDIDDDHRFTIRSIVGGVWLLTFYHPADSDGATSTGSTRRSFIAAVEAAEFTARQLEQKAAA